MLSFSSPDRQPICSPATATHSAPDDPSSHALGWLNGLKAGLAAIDDPRSRCLHPINELLFCALCAVASGADCFTGIAEFTAMKLAWFRQFIPLSKGCPSHDTFRYLFILLKPEAMQQVLAQFLQASPSQPSQRQGGGHFAFDGKTLRGSASPSAAHKAIHLLRAYCTEMGVCIGYQPCNEKSNEITALPQLLQSLNLQGSLISMDAMGTQREIVKQIIDQGGDYLVALKGNQSGALEAVETKALELQEALAIKEGTDLPAASAAVQPLGTEPLSALSEAQQKRLNRAVDKRLKPYQHHHTTELNHGRYEQRDLYVLSDLDWWPKSWKWEGLHSVIFLRRTTLRTESQTDQPSQEWFYYLCSAEASAEQLAKWIRRHWSIENSCHHVLDVTFDEDHCQVRDAQAAINFSILRDAATALLKADASKQSLASKRRKAAWNDHYRSTLISHIFHA
jgi:predicted transposase YbfD/YdcC